MELAIDNGCFLNVDRGFDAENICRVADLKQKITEVFHSIPEETVRKAVMDMKTRAQKLVMKEGLGFEGKIIRI